MTQFIITYLGGNQPATPDEGRAHFAKYMQWINGLGEAAVSAMNPLKTAIMYLQTAASLRMLVLKCRVSLSSKLSLLKLL